MEYYSISCINYCSFVNIYNALFLKKEQCLKMSFNTGKSLHFRLNL